MFSAFKGRTSLERQHTMKQNPWKGYGARSRVTQRGLGEVPPLWANHRSISHRCHPILVAFAWELTEETIDLPLGCLQDASHTMKQNPWKGYGARSRVTQRGLGEVFHHPLFLITHPYIVHCMGVCRARRS